MKRMMKFSVLVLIMGLVLGLVGCDSEDDETVIDYTNYTSNFSIRVKNDTNKKLVAFKGSPDSTTLISGIPIGGGTHGLKKDTALFSTTSDFLLFLVTEEDYLTYKGNWAALESKLFTRFYAFYNANSVNENVYRITSILGGNSRIVLNNGTSYNVELRRNSAEYGEPIGYTTATTANTTFYVEAGDYTLFPVFRKFNSTLGEIMSAFPTWSSGVLEGQCKYIEHQLTNTGIWSINAIDFLQDLKLAAGAAFLEITNNTASGIRFFDGGEPVLTESGGAIINQGKSLLFPIYMGRTGEQKFQPSVRKEQLRLGTALAATNIPLPTNKPEDDPEFEGRYIEGKMYQLNVTGDASNMTFSAITQIGDWSF